MKSKQPDTLRVILAMVGGTMDVRSDIPRIERTEMKSDRQYSSGAKEQRPADVALERHYSPQQVADMWGVSANTVRRAFRGEPGVVEFGSDETLRHRRRKIMRIPESALIRVHERRRSS
jgi:hypothetical protein